MSEAASSRQRDNRVVNLGISCQRVNKRQKTSFKKGAVSVVGGLFQERAGLSSLVRLLALGLPIPLDLPHDSRSLFALVLQPETLGIGDPPRRGGIGAIYMLAVGGDDPDPRLRHRLLGMSRHGHGSRSRNQSVFKQQGGALSH